MSRPGVASYEKRMLMASTDRLTLDVVRADDIARAAAATRVALCVRLGVMANMI